MLLMLAVSLPSEDLGNVFKMRHIYICTFAVMRYLHLVAGLAPHYVRVHEYRATSTEYFLVLEDLLGFEM